MADSTHESGHSHHIVSNKVLNWTFLQLFIAMLATIAAARLPFDGPKFFPGMTGFFNQFQNMWWLTNLIALGIAIFKAVQVIKYFMGVKYASNLAKLYCVGGFFGFSMLFILFWDYVGRPYEPVQGWERMPETAFPRDRIEVKEEPAGHASETPVGESSH